MTPSRIVEKLDIVKHVRTRLISCFVNLTPSQLQAVKEFLATTDGVTKIWGKTKSDAGAAEIREIAIQREIDAKRERAIADANQRAQVKRRAIKAAASAHAKEVIATNSLSVVADRGYHNGEEI